MIFQLIVGILCVGFAWQTRGTNDYSLVLFMEGMILINLALLNQKRKSLSHL